MKKEIRRKRNLGIPKIIPLPEGWKHGESGYIIPTMGFWKDRPIAIESKFAELLGWPGECREKLKLSIEYPDGTVVNEDGSITKKKEIITPDIYVDEDWVGSLKEKDLIPVLDELEEIHPRGIHPGSTLTKDLIQQGPPSDEPETEEKPCDCGGTVTISLLDGWIHHSTPACEAYRVNALKGEWDDVSEYSIIINGNGAGDNNKKIHKE